MDELDRMIVDSLKVTYLTGKGNNHLVPLLIPEDTTVAIDILCDLEVRCAVGVRGDNPYVFPSTRLSENHVSGWHSMHNVCDRLPLKEPQNMKATTNRHRVSTLFAALDLSKNDREYFYKHMGHSAQINEQIYQAPLALMEVTKIGKPLMEIDQGSTKQNARDSKSTFKPTDDDCKKTENDSNSIVNPSSNSKKRLRLTGESVKNFCESDSYDDEKQTVDSVEWLNKRKRVQKLPKKGYGTLSWSDDTENDFMKRFGGFVKRAEEDPMPSRAAMKQFLADHKLDFAFTKVRNKINNERAKWDKLVQLNMKKLSIPV
ncbi:uncharacterized protein LOC130645002 isoform X2 [Hydractinia symbiolongicarpus]|uniref:uncharacterized protein LOC130645002 isoform X2 n=1 Tax=Hydractinia symbiolongicarpus TaxID=13093 RepID=UPI00254A7431|nr:uncharacterized protein LOC130645002 isoform X2 [Hydractinia symbiolongicarpus]